MIPTSPDCLTFAHVPTRLLHTVHAHVHTMRMTSTVRTANRRPINLC
jgi:hypothetical protein